MMLLFILETVGAAVLGISIGRFLAEVFCSALDDMYGRK